MFFDLKSRAGLINMEMIARIMHAKISWILVSRSPNKQKRRIFPRSMNDFIVELFLLTLSPHAITVNL